MGKPGDAYVVDRFFEVFAELTEPERNGLIVGLRANSRLMAKKEKDKGKKPAPGQLPLGLAMFGDTAEEAEDAPPPAEPYPSAFGVPVGTPPRGVPPPIIGQDETELAFDQTGGEEATS